MAYDFSSLDGYPKFNVTKNTRTVLDNGLLLSRAKDNDSKPYIDAASDAIVLGFDAVYVISRDDTEAEDSLWLMFEYFIGFICLVPYDDEPAMATFAQGLAKLSTKSRSESYNEFEIPKRPGAIAEVKAFTAFLTRLCATPQLWASTSLSGIFKLKNALECELPSRGAIRAGTVAAEIEFKLWVATEWILQAGESVYEVVAQDMEDAGESVRGYDPGPLYVNAQAGRMGITRDRWPFWRRRLVELQDTVAQENEALYKRMAESVQAMDRISSKKEGNATEEDTAQEDDANKEVRT